MLLLPADSSTEVTIPIKAQCVVPITNTPESVLLKMDEEQKLAYELIYPPVKKD